MIAGADVQMREHATASNWLFGLAYGLYPEARKAVLMATASQDVDGNPPDWDSFVVDDRDGAGELNACAAVLLSDAQYSQLLNGTDSYEKAGVAVFDLDTSDCTPWCPQVGKAKIPSGATVKLAVNWLSDVDCSWSASSYNCLGGLPENFNIKLDCPSGVVDSYSYSVASAYEYIEWTNTTGVDVNCDIRFWWYGGTTGGVYAAGMAFMTTTQLQEWYCHLLD